MNPSDPLAGLHPIHLPPEVGWWPPAIGWWFLALLLSAALGWLAVWILRRHRDDRYRHVALAELEMLLAAFAADADHARFAAGCNQLLRRAALRRYPAAGVAALTGAQWLAFLDRSGGTDAFGNGPGKALADAPYAPAAAFDAAALHRACATWLRRHA